MRKSRYTEEQIIQALQECDAGAKLVDLVRRLGVTELTLCRRKKKYGGLQVNEANRLQALEEEIRQLKRLVAEQAWNLQVVRGLHVWRRKRKRVTVPRMSLATPTNANERWSMDFVRDALGDALGDGRAFRALTLVHDCTRECPAIEVDFSLPGERSCGCSIASPRDGAIPTRSSATMGRRSAAERSTSGPTSITCRSRSSNPASRYRMPISRASTGRSATSA